LNKRKVLKGTRWLLLCNGKDIYDDKFKSRLDNALKMNEPLAQSYYLKESLKEIWTQITKQEAEVVLQNWIKQAKDTGVNRIIKFANTLQSHQYGILAWYDYHISTGKVEGINNKIKTMKRQAYGYRDQKFFELKILALNDKNYAFVG
jgi:transposase